MDTNKDQHKVGTPKKPRGQQMGFAGQHDQNREEMDDTPALRGRRQSANKMFADKSSQHISTDSSKPMTNSPSLPAMNVKVKGESGGEREFKQRLAKKRHKN
ncbi:MAG TPA: hypothetical protein VIG25_11120 [Pyrinomonadaceae bacterium]|jgi:hypothetical protein